MKVSALWFAGGLIVAAIPLVLRKVPPNEFYGFRTPKTRSSPDIWYEANYKAGVNLLAGCLLTLAIAGVMAATAGAARANQVALPTLVTLVVAGLGVSFVQLQRM